MKKWSSTATSSLRAHRPICLPTAARSSASCRDPKSQPEHAVEQSRPPRSSGAPMSSEQCQWCGQPAADNSQLCGRCLTAQNGAQHDLSMLPAPAKEQPQAGVVPTMVGGCVSAVTGAV